jgi:hypothetical protein
MTRKLVFESTVSEKRERAISLAPDAPSFELGTPPDEEQKRANANHGKAESKVTLETIVHGVPGCSKLANDQSARSITPVAREYEKRVVKQAKYTKPPFVNSEPPKTYMVGKSVETLYNMVCEHGWEKNPGDPDNG